jgi:Aminoglycoside/hydroxyurea antibiotic resistance kinase
MSFSNFRPARHPRSHCDLPTIETVLQDCRYALRMLRSCASDPIRKSKYDAPRPMPFDNRSAAWHLSTRWMIVPEQLSANCRNHGQRQRWLDSLPAMLEELTRRWSLRPGPPLEHENVTSSWVAPVVCADGMSAVLKLRMPHMEGASEIQGLRFWNGNPTVQLLEADNDLGAMLLERCQPGYSLHSEPEHKQDIVIATLTEEVARADAARAGTLRCRPEILSSIPGLAEADREHCVP